MNTRELYQEIVELAGLELKGKNMLYTSANGHMYSQLNKDGEIGIRMSKADQKEMSENYGATEFRSYGAKMRDYIRVPEDQLADKKLLADWLKKGHEFVLSLEPK